ncbi:hypothetical protein A9Q99_08645 [Gammaproteobacteria bacterium 45_16_T64]|nr:hypothetical protein A9Q99_08645 [Gammaproteobacteria bacterium 45_16_T64]
MKARSYDPAITKGQILIETKNKVFNIRPKIWQKSLVPSHRYELDRRYPSYPKIFFRIANGIDISELPGLEGEEQEEISSLYSQWIEGPFLKSNVAVNSQCKFSISHCSDVKLRKKQKENIFSLDLGCMGENLPRIATAACRGKTFKFLGCLSVSINDSVSLLKDGEQNRYILKHVSNHLEFMDQNEYYYESTFSILFNLRNAKKNEKLLSTIGADISIIPVLSDFDFVSVGTEGASPILVYFKLERYVSGTVTLKQAAEEKALDCRGWKKIVRNIATYLARLHTIPNPIELFHTGSVDSEEPTVVVTANQIHFHPHFENWLIDTESKKLYLIDWDRYARYQTYNGSPECPILFSNDIVFVQDSIKRLLKDESKELVRVFNDTYLKTWNENAIYRSEDDRKVICHYLESFFAS